VEQIDNVRDVLLYGSFTIRFLPGVHKPMLKELLSRSRNAVAVKGISVVIADDDKRNPGREPAEAPLVVTNVT
jgi:hypothetical protein